VSANIDVDTQQPLLQARGVQMWYERGLPGEQHALRGVDLEVRAGDRVGLLGASGSGKSTLLHILARLQTPSEGEVRSIAPQLPSLVFQFPERQLFAESVADEVGYGLAASGVPKAEIEARVQKALDDVGLDASTFARRAPFHLSGGERRRVALATILAQRRALVLLDEPTLALDRDGTRRLTTILGALHRQDVACWVASHDTDFVAETCTHLVVLVEGAVAFRGRADDYWAQPERAERHGVRPPRAARLAAQLRAYGIEGLAIRPGVAQLAGVLAAAHHKPGPTG